MLKYLLSSRAIQGGVVFFVVVVGGSLLYSWHVRRTTEAELGEIVGFQVALETQDRAGLPQEPGDLESGASDLEPHQTQGAIEETDAFVIDTSAEFDDMADAFFPMVSDEEQVSEDVPVSPYGFGPYPEIPAGYPLAGSVPWTWSEEEIARMEADPAAQDHLMLRGITFEEYMITFELMARVGIKLWNEGSRFNGMTTSDETGRFYPNEPDVLYVEWDETVLSNGEVRRYMMHTIGSAVSGLSIAAQEGREPLPDWIEIRSLDEGIDPYEFLGISR